MAAIRPWGVTCRSLRGRLTTVELEQSHINLLRYVCKTVRPMELFASPAWFRDLERAGLILIRPNVAGGVVIAATQAGRDALADFKASGKVGGGLRRTP